MATSGSKSVTVTSWDTLKFSWSTSNQSVANNTSTVSWKLQLIATSSGRISSTASKDWSVTVNGTKYSGTNTIGISNNATKTLASGTTTISHNSDGTKTFNYSFSQEFAITFSGSYIGTKSGSGSGTLNTIPRASQPSLVTYPDTTQKVTIGSTITIHMNKKASFTHTVRYAWGNKSGTIATGVTDNCAWTIPMNFCDNIPNSTSGTGTVYVDTYSGSTKIGTKSVGFTGTVPSSVVPSISSIALSEGGSLVPSSWGVYVRGKSKLKVVTSASGSYSSTIKSYKITGIDSNTYTASSFTSSTLTTSGTRTITVTVTDSRGRTASKTTTYTCVAYSNPVISSASVTRCNSDGTSNAEGTSVKYTFKASVSSISSKNTYSYKLGYKLSSASSYTYVTISNSAYTLDKSNVVISGVEFDVDSSYDFQFLVSDYFTNTSLLRNVSTGFTLMNFNASGKGIGIGKVSEGDKLEIALPMEIIENDICMEKTSGSTYYNAKRSDTGREVCYGVGSGGYNRGIWDIYTNQWLFAFSDVDLNIKGVNGLITSSNETTTYFGTGSGYSGVTSYLRGNNVRIYAHDGGVYLGSSGSTAITSDEKLKDICEIDGKYIEFFNNLKPITYIYKNKGHRNHIGFGARQVEEALIEAGLTTEQFAGVLKDKDVTIYADEMGTEEDIHYDELYSLRYEEFIALNTLMIQKQAEEIKSLKEEVENLKSILKERGVIDG